MLLIPATFGLLALATPDRDRRDALRQRDAQRDARGRPGRSPSSRSGLPAFAAYQLLLRVFYAQQDSRTPALINLVANGVNIVGDVVLVAVLPASDRIPGLALGFVLSYVAGALLAARRLRPRLRGLDGYRVLRLLARVGIAAVLGSALALGGVGRGAGRDRRRHPRPRSSPSPWPPVSAVRSTWPPPGRCGYGELTALLALVRR